LIKGVKVENNQAVVTYQFSEEDMNVLKHLKEHGYMEFRNGAKSEIVDNLYDYGFVKSDDDAWHYTVKLTELGEQVVSSMVE
jgi:ribosomal protein S8